MSKPISRPVHGVLDYGYAAAIASSPNLFGFEEQPAAKALCRAMGAAVLLTSLFKLHLGTDVLAGIFSLGAPWLFKFSGEKSARNTFVGFGILALVVASLTQPDEMK